MIGPTLGTEAGDGYDPERLAHLLPLWTAHGFMTRKLMRADDLGALLAEALGACFAHPEIAVEDLSLEPPGPPAGAGEGA